MSGGPRPPMPPQAYLVRCSGLHQPPWHQSTPLSRAFFRVVLQAWWWDMSEQDDERNKILDEIRYFGDRPMYIGKKGEPLTLRQWSAYSEDMSYKRIAYDELPATSVNPASYVSTVWLGIDHNFLFQGPPIIFETMRFSLEKAPLEMFPDRTYHPSLEFPDLEDPDRTTDQERYLTEEQASIGHRTIVRLIQEREMS